LELRISDIHKILTVEYDKSDGERRECLGRGLHHQKQVLGSIHSANKDNTTDGHLIRKGSSLQKFEMAENFCSAPLPDSLWEHYYAKALNQYYDSLERHFPYTDGGLEAEMRAVTMKALEKFVKKDDFDKIQVSLEELKALIIRGMSDDRKAT